VLATFKCCEAYDLLTHFVQIGPEYIPIAFETAALYDSSVKLYYVSHQSASDFSPRGAEAPETFLRSENLQIVSEGSDS
jgi:hypothetical protein